VEGNTITLGIVRAALFALHRGQTGHRFDIDVDGTGTIFCVLVCMIGVPLLGFVIVR
jgi:hypothetical protein